MRSDVFARAEKLVDIALSIANVYAGGGPFKQCGRLPQVIEPADTLFLLDRHARRVNSLLQSIRALELVARPELDRCEPQRQPVRRHCQTRMHQNAARCIEPR